MAQEHNIMQLTVNNFIFRAVYLSIEIKLSEFPKTMYLYENLKKGDLPFLFSTIQNQNYKELWPKIDLDSNIATRKHDNGSNI